MPTANANTGNGFSKAVSYVLQEQKEVPAEKRSEVLQQNNVYGNSREIGKQMREVAQEREKVQKPVLHLQINFHPDEKLNKEQAQKAVNGVLKEIGIDKEKHQYLVVQHKDKAHDHYHVIVNRVSMEGDLLNDHRIKDRLQVACDKIEKEQGLRPTKGRTVMYDPSNKKGFRYATTEEKKAQKQQNEKVIIRDKNPAIMQSKAELTEILSNALSKKEISTPERLKEELEKKGVDVQYSSNKNGISGISFKKDDISVKGSAIGYKWNDIKKDLEENKTQSEDTKKVSDKELKKEFVVNIRPAGTREATPQEEEEERLIRQKVEAEFKYKYPQKTHADYDEIRYLEQYSDAVKLTIDHYKSEINEGNINCNLEEVFKRNINKCILQDHLLKNDHIEKDLGRFNRVQKDVLNQYNSYEAKTKEYNDLMLKQPETINLFDRLTPRGKEKEERNKDLKKMQKSAVKPEFRPKIHIIERDFEKASAYSKKIFEWEVKNQQAKTWEKVEQTKQENKTKDQTQDQELRRRKGMGL